MSPGSRVIASLLVLTSGCSAHSRSSPANAPVRGEERSFTFEYSVEIDAPPAGAGPVHVFVPLAQSDAHQEIVRRHVQSSVPGSDARDETYGNAFWHGRIERSDGKPITITVSYDVRRRVQRATPVERGAPLPRFLEADRLVPVNGDLIDRIRRDIPWPQGASSLDRVRAIYDFVIDNMEYKKIGSGWGNGDTFWACSQKYGNCTDFHALFISMVRAEGIPAKFEIGFPVPVDRPAGTISGYHCWAEFFLPDAGWVPVDASEAWKHPDHRDLYFGTLPSDRVLFTTGRDIELGEGHASAPLNYFVYPHVEVEGRPWPGLRTRFDYRERNERFTAGGLP